MNRTRWGLVAVAVPIGAVAATWILREPDPWTTGDLHELEGPLEDPDAASATLARRTLAYARARVNGTARTSERSRSGDLDRLPGRKLWLCAYRVPGGPWCGEGDGDTLAAAVDRAVDAIRAKGTPPASTVWKLDWELARTPAFWPDDAGLHEAGTVGLAVGRATVLPSEVLERGLFSAGDEDDVGAYDHPAIVALLEQRGASPNERFRFDRIRTASWVEPAPGAPPVRTYRLHEWEWLDTDDADAVLVRAVWAAEALARTVEADGRIAYRWDTVRGHEKRGQNLLRHAGSTWSLIQAWARTRHEPWRQAAARALGYLLSKSETDERTGPYGGGKGRYLVEGNHIKLGGAGLALVALATWQATSGDASRRDEAGEFATYLVSAQQTSGEFVYFASRTPGGPPRDDTSSYYPGEAVLGLVLWSALDPDPRWLATARRGADWIIDVRDAGKGPAQLDNDHWMMLALHRLYVVTRDPRYAAHSRRLAEAVLHQRSRQAGHDQYHRDYRGGFYEPPRSTPAATRAEGLVAVLDLLAEDGKTDPDVRALLLDTVRHLTQSQYTPSILYWMPEPGRVVGAVAGGVLDPDLRNDFTQHALSALLGTERVLRRESGQPLFEPNNLDGMLAPLVLDTPEPTL